jgi:hypothetical protein
MIPRERILKVGRKQRVPAVEANLKIAAALP